jgi:hypothetical protein
VRHHRKGLEKQSLLIDRNANAVVADHHAKLYLREFHDVFRSTLPSGRSASDSYGKRANETAYF